MQDLPLQVGLVDDVGVDDPERSDARGGEVERGGRAEAAGTDQEDPGLEQLQLPFFADLRDQQMAAVAGALLRGKRAGRDLEWVAVALPVVDAAGQRDDVLVPELLEGSSCERRAVAGGAVRDDRLGAVGDRLLDPRFEPAARKVDGAGDVALVPLLALADVEENCRIGVVVQLPGALRVDLVDLLPGLLEKVAVRAHCFPFYSDWPEAMVEA